MTEEQCAKGWKRHPFEESSWYFETDLFSLRVRKEGDVYTASVESLGGITNDIDVSKLAKANRIPVPKDLKTAQRVALFAMLLLLEGLVGQVKSNQAANVWGTKKSYNPSSNGLIR